MEELIWEHRKPKFTTSFALYINVEILSATHATLKVPITKNFLFSYLKLYLVQITSAKNFAMSTKRDFFTNF